MYIQNTYDSYNMPYYTYYMNRFSKYAYLMNNSPTYESEAPAANSVTSSHHEVPGGDPKSCVQVRFHYTD